jgi:L-fucose mutarotase/ribose pyranase (RbsD/FucU family)
MKSASRSANQKPTGTVVPPWEESLRKNLPLYGHRNWVVVADSAYPSQSRQGIETIVADEDQQSVVEKVLSLLRSTHHVRPVIHLDRELAFVYEDDAPGVGVYRDWLKSSLEGAAISTQPHEDIISMLDRAALAFCVMVIKTNMTIPYTTVFFELDCAYWDGDSERRLRAAMQA